MLMPLRPLQMEVFSAEHRRKLFGRSIFHTRIGNLINIPFLGIPLIYLSRVEQICESRSLPLYVRQYRSKSLTFVCWAAQPDGDEVGFRNASWREFIEGLVMEVSKRSHQRLIVAVDTS